MINAQLREERSLHVDLGALVVAVVADSTARAAGLDEGNIILGVNG
jgi:S1-C subfamily serine protease